MKFFTLAIFFLLSLNCETKTNRPDALKSKNTEMPGIDSTEVLVCKGSASYAYHDHYCQGLNKCRAQVVRMLVDQAKKLGRKPCGYCYNTAPLKSNVKNATYQEATGQCNAITKLGTRCSRKPGSGGYCWQHGG